ncbi:hypothetical protein L3K73_03070 [Holdemanella sp. SCCA2]|nr:hypothetical protein [Holdemanella sp. SCCA2]
MKKIPEIFVNKINKKIDNNKEVFYSYKDTDEIIEEPKRLDEYTLQRKINELFRSNDFIYKKKFHIKTINEEKDYIIISKSYDYLLTIDGTKIMIKDIIEIN